MKQKTFTTVLWLAILLCSSCIARLNSSFESARTLGKRNVEVTGNYSHYFANIDGESGATNDNIGLRVGYGLTDQVDLKLRYERIKPSMGEVAINYIGLAPKFALSQRKFAFTMPLGLYFASHKGDTDSEFVISPKILATLPAKNNKVEATLASKVDFSFEKGADPLLGFNFGFGFSSDLDRWAIRPELGLMVNPGESGQVWTFGLGFNYNFLSKTKN